STLSQNRKTSRHFKRRSGVSLNTSAKPTALGSFTNRKVFPLVQPITHPEKVMALICGHRFVSFGMIHGPYFCTSAGVKRDTSPALSMGVLVSVSIFAGWRMGIVDCADCRFSATGTVFLETFGAGVAGIYLTLFVEWRQLGSAQRHED